jgi:hypothetical protein
MKYGRDKFFIVYGSPMPSLDALSAATALRKRGLWAEAYLEGVEGCNGVGYPAEGTDAWKREDLK